MCARACSTMFRLLRNARVTGSQRLLKPSLQVIVRARADEIAQTLLTTY